MAKPKAPASIRTREEAIAVIKSEHAAVKIRAMTDLYYLAKHILGYEQLTDRFHRPLCGLVSAVNPQITHQACQASPLFQLLSDKIASEDAESSYSKAKTSDNVIELSASPDSNSFTANNLQQVNPPLHNYDYRRMMEQYFGASYNVSQPERIGGGGVGGVSAEPHTQNFKKFSGNTDRVSEGGADRSSEREIDVGSDGHGLSSLRFPHGLEAGLAREWEERGWMKWEDGARERLWMMFRGSFKTTIITICHTIQLMLLWPDIRIFIQSHKKDGGSVEILHAIKRHFVANERFRSLFAEWCPTPNTVGQIEWGTTERVTLVNRSPSCAWPEATIEIAGTNTDVTGRHYDYIKNDDLVTRESVTNETMIQKTRQIKALQKFLFNQPEWGVTDNVGTFYHFNDIYNTLKKSKGVSRVIIPIVTDDQIPVEKWQPTVPERFTKEGCYGIKTDATMTLEDWNNQYMLNPVPPEDQTFKPEYFERLNFYYDPAELLNIPLRKYLFVDPASKRRKKNDFTAIVVIGVDKDGFKYLIEAVRDKLGVEDRTNLVIELAHKHELKSIHYETIGFQDSDKSIIEMKCRGTGKHINVIEIKNSHSAKTDRIKGLEPIYRLGLIRWPKKLMYYSAYEKKRIDMIEILKDELLMFPKCEHDDLSDCHSMMLKVFEIRPSGKVQDAKPDLFEQLRQLKKRNEALQKFRGFGKRGQGRSGLIPARRTLW